MSSRVADEERERIVAYIDEGHSQGEAAKKFKRGKGTISRVISESGTVPDRSRTKRAVEAKREWDQARRVELVGKGMAHAEKMLPGLADPKELQSWMVAVATGIDKLRLESGEATSRHEDVDPERRERMRQSLDEIAAQRRKRAG